MSAGKGHAAGTEKARHPKSESSLFHRGGADAESTAPARGQREGHARKHGIRSGSSRAFAGFSGGKRLVGEGAAFWKK